jgi:Reverse transcriptase (RNA-dependent DNA polymerase)
VKWVYRIKLDDEAGTVKFKARITPKGYLQERGVDYFEIYAPTVAYKTLRMLLSLVAKWDYELDQMDVSSAFLHALLKEEAYVEIPEGYTAGKSGDWVLRLKKALYGIHQAPREWYLLLSKFVVESMGFTQSVCDRCLFFKRSQTGRLMLLVVFVDDFQVGFHREDAAEWAALKKIFMARFKTKDLGESRVMLGMRIQRDRARRTITLDQEAYIAQKLEEFNMADCNEANTPASVGADLSSDDPKVTGGPVDAKLYSKLVGSLLYAALSTRPDVAHAVHQLTMHVQHPKQVMAAKHVLRYLKGTKDVGLQFGGRDTPAKTSGEDGESVVSGFCDADYASKANKRRSITGWLCRLNSDVVNWQTKKQALVSLSTCEAELYATAALTQEVLWQRHLLHELQLKVRPQSVIRCDNVSAIDLAEHGVIRERTKHVDVKYEFITQHIERDEIKVIHVSTLQQQADMLTKALAQPAFERHRSAAMTR